MNTEEETFNRLKRAPFNIVCNEITINYYANRNKSTGLSAIDIMTKHGWTYSEFMDKSEKENYSLSSW